jgi:serine/threonine-protein phosphatase 4 regulatory subunit 2
MAFRVEFLSELPQYPNVDPFNYETMKKMLIERLESFSAAPFTIQRISELLSDPRKQYSRIDKFMRAVEKTILVVSTVPPGRHRSESENGDSLDSALNGEFSSEVNVDIDMEQDGFGGKEPIASTSRKDEKSETPNGHDDSVTKNGSLSKDEPGTSTSTNGSKSIEKEKTETPESSSDNVFEPKASEPEAAAEKDKTESSEVPKPESSKDEVKTDVLVALGDSAELKADEALSNQPIRSDENEILVDTSEIISETTPLAALENIVAIRTEPTVDHAEPVAAAASLPAVEPVKAEESEKVAEQTEKPVEEESEIEAKRLKLAEVPEATEVTAKNDVKQDEQPQESPAVEPVEKPSELAESATPVTTEMPLQEQIPSSEKVEIPVASSELILPEKIDEPLPKIAEIPIEIVPPVDQDIAEPPPAEMETVPTITENTMSLDEDEPPAIELEMTPIANKMDTDEAEAAPMDFEDDAEPMDQ